MQDIITKFRRPSECPVIDLQLYCKSDNEYQKFRALVDTGAARSIIDKNSFKRTVFDVITGYKRGIGGFGKGSQDCEYTAIITKIEDIELKAVGYFVADLSNGQNPESVSGESPQYIHAWQNPSTSIISRLHNNIYNFVPFLNDNTLSYENSILAFGNNLRDILSVPEWVNMNHDGQGAASVENHKAGANIIRLEYTAWQEPSSPFSIPQGPHQGLDNPTAYMGINPIIIHNPVSSIFSWVHDTPLSVLQDQRVNNLSQQQDGGIVPHPRRESEEAARLYIDFDFRITIPNDGTFASYWHYEPAQTGSSVGRDRDGVNQCTAP